MPSISVSISDEVFSKILELQDETGKTKSKLIDELLKKKLEEIEEGNDL